MNNFYYALDSHSKLCNKVSQKVNLMENSNIIDQINFKIEKILAAIEKLHYEIKGFFTHNFFDLFIFY